MPTNGSHSQYYRRTVLGSSATAVGSLSGCAAKEGGTQTGASWTDTPNELTPIEGGERETEFLDQVYFGNADSEGDRVSVTDAPVVEGGLEVPAREVAAQSGEITAELACDPEEQNLVTMRLWGGDSSRDDLSAAVEGSDVFTDARVDRPRVGNRFYYVTIAVPPTLTAGRESVEVTLTAEENSPDHAYAVYTHTENFYEPPADEVQGEPLEEPTVSDPDFDVLRENLIEGADVAINGLMQAQNTNEEDTERYGNVGGLTSRRGAIASDDFLRAYMLEGSKYQGDEEMIERALLHFDSFCRYQGYRGAVDRQSWPGAQPAPANEEDEPWGIGSGLPGFMGTQLGVGFVRAIPIFEERPELLDVEIDATGDGEVNTTRRQAYTRFWREYLWENMLLRWGLGQKTWNQVIVNGASMIYANEMLKYLSPEDAAPDDIIIGQARAKSGILPIKDHIIDFVLELQVRNEGEYGIAPGTTSDPTPPTRLEDGRHYENRHWNWSRTRHYTHLSEKGVAIEFGYSPGYSWHMRHTFLSDIADDHQIDDQVRRYFDGMQHFIYPTDTQFQGGGAWSRVGAIGERGRGRQMSPFKLGKRTGSMVYAAMELDSEPAKRFMQKQLRHMDDLEGVSSTRFTGSALAINGHLRWLEHFSQLREWYESEEPTDYRLPTEREGPYAWCDEMAGVVMIQEAGGTHYLEMMNPSQQLRYHRITDRYRAFGDAKADFCPSTQIETRQLGPYEIVMNRSNSTDARVPGGPRPHVSSSDADGLVDIVSGQTVDPAADTLLGPNQSLVLDSRRRADAPATTSQPAVDGTALEERTMTKHWEWTVPESCAGADVYSLTLDESDATDRVAKYYEDAVTRGTGQHPNHVATPYRPDEFDDGTPISAWTDAGESLDIEVVDRCQNRLVVDRPDDDATTIEAEGILPTFRSYDDWTVDKPGWATVSTEDALDIEIAENAEGTEITGTYPITVTLPIEQPVERIVFLHESNFDLSSLQTVLETDDGRTLWEGTHPQDIGVPTSGARYGQWNARPMTDELVDLKDVDVTDALHFRIRRNEAPADMDDLWYRELTDGAAQRMSPHGEATTITTADEAIRTPTNISKDSALNPYSKGWFRRISAVRIEYADGTAQYKSG